MGARRIMSFNPVLDTCFFLPIPSYKHHFNSFQVTMVVMSFLTNCLIDGLGEDCSGEGAIVQSLMAIFSGQGGVFAFCQSYPAIRCFISPPNVRNRPHWYPRFRPIILRVLQQIMLGRPLNLQLLEDHPGEHLFYASFRLAANLLQPETVTVYCSKNRKIQLFAAT